MSGELPHPGPLPGGEGANAPLSRRFSTEQETISSVFYFEDDIEIYVYQLKGNIILCAEVYKENISDLAAFKMENLSSAVELLERPKENTLVIKQE